LGKLSSSELLVGRGRDTFWEDPAEEMERDSTGTDKEESGRAVTKERPRGATVWSAGVSEEDEEEPK